MAGEQYRCPECGCKHVQVLNRHGTSIALDGILMIECNPKPMLYALLDCDECDWAWEVEHPLGFRGDNE